ncbi:MAG: hypothetical protein HY303_22165, partial [Candidatus Wallbacteria bacterium]|nr:hypothetical protein [Candidatus Wallbacteria bacterium]
MTTPDSAKPEPTESGTLRESAFALLLVAAFAVVAVFGICHHEMWRDEIELLQVSLSSRSVGEYLHNIDICGHPRFYFLFVYALSRITGNPAVVPFAHLGIVLAAVFIWSMWAPFTRLQKTLFCFGYYPLFEYGVIARNYSIGLLVLFAFCACFCRKGRSYSGLGAVLACIALTNAHAIVIAVALVMALVLEALLDPETRASVGQKRRDAVTGLALACLGIALGFAQIKEPPGASLSWDFSFGARRAGCTLSIVFDSYVPVPDMTREHWWNTNCLGALRPEMLRQVA